MSVVLSPTLLTSIQQELNHVEKLEFETGLDSEGEPANWIWVVINAKAPKKAWSWESNPATGLSPAYRCSAATATGA